MIGYMKHLFNEWMRKGLVSIKCSSNDLSLSPG